jgi:hypothetical protein
LHDWHGRGHDSPTRKPRRWRGGVLMVLGSAALLAVVLAGVPPDPDPVLF